VKSISGKRLCKLLEQKGWECKRIKGSHHIYCKDGNIERISVPVHANADLKVGLLKTLMKIAAIDEHEL
jgi:predicted RNA binding protein YcfA (HicA-like mRNA interferase family)